MQATNRIILNTIAQYTRTIINVLLSLYSTRLVLSVLGNSDYGLYSLVGGVVALLSFLTNSLVVATQRFLSVSIGKGNQEKVKTVFNSSLVIHIILGLVVVLVLEVLAPFFFSDFLNIPQNRTGAAVIIYHLVVIMLFSTFVTAPFRALLISHENIIYISIVDVLDGVLKLVLVLLLPYATVDKLMLYGVIMLGINLFNFSAFSIYSYKKFEECILPQRKYFQKDYYKELMSFTGWVLYSNFCIVGRNQGLAVVLNKLLGTVANAAYGIGTQIAGYISFVSSSFATAIGPQLMKAKGKSDEEHMMYLAKFQSKIAYLLLAMLTIPTVFEMQTLLELWLEEVPQHTTTFAIMVLVGLLVDQPTQGLATTFQAVGKLRTYTIVDYTPKFILLPLCWFLLKTGCEMWTIALSYILIEVFCMLLRIPLIKKVIDFDVKDYASYVFLKTILPTVISIAVCAVIVNMTDSAWRFLLTYVISVPIFIICAYLFSLTSTERDKVNRISKELTAKLMLKRR